MRAFSFCMSFVAASEKLVPYHSPFLRVSKYLSYSFIRLVNKRLYLFYSLTLSFKLIFQKVIGGKRRKLKLDKKLDETVENQTTIFKSFLSVKFQTKNSHHFNIHIS